MGKQTQVSGATPLPAAKGILSVAACLHFESSYFAVKEFLHIQIARCKCIQEENAPLV